MTRQQIFNTAYHGLAAQGFTRSTQSDGVQCAYRGTDNKRCALGYLIPDAIYNPEWDRARLNAHALANENITKAICKENSDFLVELQEAHDYAHAPEDMMARLAEFAQLNGLTIPAIPDFAVTSSPADTRELVDANQ
jgi:hypothetical protein